MNNLKFDRTVYTIPSFLEVAVTEWGERLKKHHLDCMKEEANYHQRKAWFECYTILKRELTLLFLPKQNKDEIYIVFEYELPRERGRRPDVLLLSGNNLVVLEFKGYNEKNQAHIDQVKHYARDLRNYHEKSHALNVIPVLVLTKVKNIHYEEESVLVCSSDNVHLVLRKFVGEKFQEIKLWFESEYAPLPSLLQSAQLLFKEQEFPQIKRAQSAGIPTTLKKLLEIARHSKQNGTHHLALITGVPGAGKTLVGLQFVFETISQTKEQKAVFLSGNGPLVDVLQFSLGNRNFVQSVHGFLKAYALSPQLPSENIIIYDEAQRAWDAEKVAGSNRAGKNAEPTDFIFISDKKPHILLIGLIGEGQEIYLGEESGIQLWVDALHQSRTKWVIHCPQKLKSHFDGQRVEIAEEFDLTTSLRTHQALTLQSWVQALLDNNLEGAKAASSKLFEEDYPIYVTRNLSDAKQYVRWKYDKEPSKTFGLLASSRSKILPQYGVQNDYHSTNSFKASQYYVDDQHTAYCKNLNSIVTEFGCQGLELDLPIVAWDADWVYHNGLQDKLPNNRAKNSFNLRKNSYRVLLTRGRDGLIIYVPSNSLLNTTYEVLKDAGCKILNPLE